MEPAVLRRRSPGAKAGGSRLWSAGTKVESTFVARLYSKHFSSWWNWHVSSQFRLASLASVWVLLFASPFLGWLMLPTLVVRTALSFTQLFLNRQLSKVHPLEPRGLADWGLLGLALLASMFAAQMAETTGHQSVWYVVPVAMIFSAIQLRMCRRSELAHAQIVVVERRVLEFPVPAAERRAA